MRHNKIWLIDDETMEKLNFIQDKFKFRNKDQLLDYMAKVVIAYIDVCEKNNSLEKGGNDGEI